MSSFRNFLKNFVIDKFQKKKTSKHICGLLLTFNSSLARTQYIAALVGSVLLNSKWSKLWVENTCLYMPHEGTGSFVL